MKSRTAAGLMAPINLDGALIWPGLLDRQAQSGLLADVLAVARVAPPLQHQTPRGKLMSVRMTAAGQFGWISDRAGYRYSSHHPDGQLWPPIPAMLLELWRSLLPAARDPECCLVNFYGEGARMGLHQDRDEADFSQPVLSVSLGDEGLFRLGGTLRAGSTASHWLKSGDVLALMGPSRLAFHGVDRIRFGSSTLLPDGGRINLTLRVVT